MSRPLRIEFPGAVYHVTSRGDRREPIYRDDNDRLAQLDVIAHAMDRFDAQLLAHCLMGNHYHLVPHTRQANLSRLMRHVNGVYTQAFNRRHGLVGHLLQGRFKSILVDRDAYLLARAPTTGTDRQRAAQMYAKLVMQADAADGDDAFWSTHLRQQVFWATNPSHSKCGPRPSPPAEARGTCRDRSGSRSPTRRWRANGCGSSFCTNPKVTVLRRCSQRTVATASR